VAKVNWAGDIPRLFLSYRHGLADKEIVGLLFRRLVEELNTGHSIVPRATPLGELFLDEQRMTAGDAWRPILRQELYTADIYLFVLSLHSAANPNAFMWREEFAIAVQRWWRGVAWIIPIIVDDVTTVLDNDPRTQFLSESHCVPYPRASFKTLLQEPWLNAV
jgi:hypothetical protein